MTKKELEFENKFLKETLEKIHEIACSETKDVYDYAGLVGRIYYYTSSYKDKLELDKERNKI